MDSVLDGNWILARRVDSLNRCMTEQSVVFSLFNMKGHCYGTGLYNNFDYNNVTQLAFRILVAVSQPVSKVWFQLVNA